MNSITIKSPAKLNLHLRILGKRKDGYHDLLTLFHRISLCDQIRIKKVPSGFRLTTNRRDLETGEGNLITRAYRLLQKKFPKIDGISVYLDKKIPLGAGLGGGSSNAAHFLLGVKKLFRLRISEPDLLRIGQSLGADVPFFLKNRTEALAWGIGEKLKVMPVKKRLWFLLLITSKGLETKKVYQKLIPFTKPLSLTGEKRIAIILRSLIETQRIREAACLVRNDLEPPAFSLRPSIPNVIYALKKAEASFVLMSGSGASVFALASNRNEAVRIAKKISRVSGYRKVICHSF